MRLQSLSKVGIKLMIFVLREYKIGGRIVPAAQLSSLESSDLMIKVLFIT